VKITKEKLETLITKILLPKADLIVNELKHELITMGEKPLAGVQEVVVDNAIRGALVSGMRATVEEILKNEN